ncbi:MAG: pitrilysin family protein [Bacteroidales bacterium]|nr:pitrilysin family protein [Bacteroidales bacterium]
MKIEKITLSNGLKVLLHSDMSTNLLAFNLLYKVGSKNEDSEKTGFAHLFEHLMFEGSKNIASYDEPLQMVGGENNAFTNNDITNYYITLPKENLETAFWLESDRMLELNFSEKKLAVQKNVVIQEFNQRYLNQPYGDISLLLKPLAYKVHPYQWATIGKNTEHIKNASLKDVKDFFYSHYAPNNAILSICGNVSIEIVRELSEKWFGGISSRELSNKNLPKEPKQIKSREKTVYRDVPYDALYKAYHMSARNTDDYFVADLISDVLSNGRSSRLYQILVIEKQIFSDIDAYISGDIDEGLFIFSGKLMHNIDIKIAEKELLIEIERLKTEIVSEYELEKVKNKFESIHQFSEISILNKAMDIAFCELLGDAELINTEISRYRNVSVNEISNLANVIFDDNNCSTLYYLSKKL